MKDNKGHFKVKSVTPLDKVKEGDVINESDYATLTSEGNFVQLEYIPAENQTAERRNYPVSPGVYSIQKTMSGLNLIETSFSTDKLLNEFIFTKNVSERINCFFKKIDVYKKFGFDIAKRCILLYGPPGSGKTSVITKVCNEYVNDGQTFILVWHTDRYHASEVKDFIQEFKYKDEVKQMILIIEDIGGIEKRNVEMASESSLLSLLDNQERTFTIPTLIVATTNYPESFMANLTNRPNRIDDKIKVDYPPAEARAALLKFFGEVDIKEEHIIEISKKAYERFTPAHIREVIVRSAIYDRRIIDVMKDMLNEIKVYEKGFEEATRGMGLMD